MQTLLLVVAIAGSFWLQYWLDARLIRAAAERNAWQATSIRWAPLEDFGRLNSWARTYWLTYTDERGASAKRWVRVTSFLGLGATIENVPAGRPIAEGSFRSDSTGRTGSGIGRTASAIVGFCVGGFLGAGVGIAVCLTLSPTSNVAPAYGILLAGPIGALTGGAVGWFRGVNRDDRAS